MNPTSTTTKPTTGKPKTLSESSDSQIASQTYEWTLGAIIERVQFELAPLAAVSTGDPHPHFPKTLMHYHLLTEAQLDSLALFYHQREPSLFRYCYPITMNWDDAFLHYIGEQYGMQQRVDIKRRKFGKFIGMRECETPVEEYFKECQWRERQERTKTVGVWG